MNLEPDPAPRDLPSGTVTFLFTDIEGSTNLLRKLGAEAYAEVLQRQRRILRLAVLRHGGTEVDTEGDACFAVFSTAAGALEAAGDAQEALVDAAVPVRMGIHTGTVDVAGDGYVGIDVNLAARIADAAHGGQVILSGATRGLLGGDYPLADLGEHRFKDFAAAVRVFQLGSERFQPLRAMSGTNLPHPVSSFVGRAREVADVVGLVREGARLLTLTGPGGSGKTRLVIEVASELVGDHPDGVRWVGLASITDPGLVPETIRRVLGSRDGLAEDIGEQDILLVLDNFEQVAEAAPDMVTLLERCPNLHLLVTSRALLRVRGEVEYTVLPLADPEAVDLFCARSRVRANATIGELCRRLDNLPLAIELAAARSGVLSPEQILERVSECLDLLRGGRDAGARQSTLRATLEWSYGLLTPTAREQFVRLGVFRGGWTLPAAEAVADADLDVLQSLVDESLVRCTNERFSMLETIHEYAAQRLEDSPESEEVHRRHAQHFLALAEEAEPHLRRDSLAWLDRLEADHDNLRAALEWLVTRGETELVLRLAGAVGRFWYLKSHLREGRRHLEAALRGDGRPTPIRAKALQGAAVMALQLGDLEAGRLRAEEALALSSTLEDAWGVAYASMLIGSALGDQDELPRARQVLEESARIFQELGDERYLLLANSNLAWVTGDLGDRERERALYAENLRLARGLGDERVEAASLAALADCALARLPLSTDPARGRDVLADAAASLREAIRIEQRRGNLLELALDLGRVAALLLLAGKAEPAATLLASSRALTERLGAEVPPWAGERHGRTLSSIRSQLEEASFAEAWEVGQQLTPDQAASLADACADEVDRAERWEEKLPEARPQRCSAHSYPDTVSGSMTIAR